MSLSELSWKCFCKESLCEKAKKDGVGIWVIFLYTSSPLPLLCLLPLSLNVGQCPIELKCWSVQDWKQTMPLNHILIGYLTFTVSTLHSPYQNVMSPSTRITVDWVIMTHF